MKIAEPWQACRLVHALADPVKLRTSVGRDVATGNVTTNASCWACTRDASRLLISQKLIEQTTRCCKSRTLSRCHARPLQPVY